MGSDLGGTVQGREAARKVQTQFSGLVGSENSTYTSGAATWKWAFRGMGDSLSGGGSGEGIQGLAVVMLGTG